MISKDAIQRYLERELDSWTWVKDIPRKDIDAIQRYLERELDSWTWVKDIPRKDIEVFKDDK